MDLSKVKPSKNLDDHTGNTKVQDFLNLLFTALNPVYASRNIRDAMIRNGYLDAPDKKIHWK